MKDEKKEKVFSESQYKGRAGHGTEIEERKNSLANCPKHKVLLEEADLRCTEGKHSNNKPQTQLSSCLD